MLSDKEAITMVAIKVPPTPSRRRTLHASALGLVEDFHLSGDSAAPSGHSPEYQVVLPYEGAVNCALEPKPRYWTPTACFSSARAKTFRKAITPRAQAFAHRLLHLAAAGSDPLAADELTIALLREALTGARPVLKTPPLRVVERAAPVSAALHVSAALSYADTLTICKRAVLEVGKLETSTFSTIASANMNATQKITPSKTLVDLETKFWQSMVDEDTDAALQMLNEPALMVSAHGAMKFDHDGYRKMAEQAPMVVTSFDLRDMEVVFPNENTAILTYRVKQGVATRGNGKTAVQERNDTSTWIMAGKQWKCVMHTETPAKGE